MVNLMTPKELNDIGDQYFYGRGSDKNIEVAFTYYKRAADQNNPVGLANVGKYFLAKNNEKDAFSYYQKAADLNYGYAYIKLSEMYLHGIGTKKSKKKAFKQLEEAVNLNEVDSYHLFGKYYLLGIGTSKNEDKALKLFELSAQNNNAEGMFLLGQLLLTGKKVKNDFESAFFHLDKAAVNKNINAINYLKKLYEEPHPYLKKKSDLYRNEMWFCYDELLANLDDVDALKRVSFAYYYGTKSVKVSYDKSIKYFKILHGLDEVEGYLGLGLSYLYGQGVEVDLERAKDYLVIAANRNNSKAKNALGDIYRLGKGVAIDYQVARDFYLEAAKDNEVDALINLGLLHYRKQIKNATDMLAMQFMTKASEYNSASSFYWLGIFYDKGIGTEPTPDLAKKNFEKAIENGNIGAKYKLAQLLYDETINQKMSKRKADKNLSNVKELLIDYIKSPLSQEINNMFAMYLLGDMYKNEDSSFYSEKISRYWYEMAAEKSFTKAMVRMYEILRVKEPNKALQWLNKACEKPADGEELYQLGLVYEQGLFGVVQDNVKAKSLFRRAAELNYKDAVVKLTMSK